MQYVVHPRSINLRASCSSASWPVIGFPDTIAAPVTASVRSRQSSQAGSLLGSGQAVRRLTLDQEIEGSNPSSPANLAPDGSASMPYMSYETPERWSVRRRSIPMRLATRADLALSVRTRLTRLGKPSVVNAKWTTAEAASVA